MARSRFPDRPARLRRTELAGDGRTSGSAGADTVQQPKTPAPPGLTNGVPSGGQPTPYRLSMSTITSRQNYGHLRGPCSLVVSQLQTWLRLVAKSSGCVAAGWTARQRRAWTSSFRRRSRYMVVTEAR